MVFMVLCVWVLSACGKCGDISNLAQVCQNAFGTWDEYIILLESKSNVPSYYLRYEQTSRQEEAKRYALVRSRESEKLIPTCEIYVQYDGDLINSLNGGS